MFTDLVPGPFSFLLLIVEIIVLAINRMYNAGANAIEFIINHADISIAFVQESKLPAVCPTSLTTNSKKYYI